MEALLQAVTELKKNTNRYAQKRDKKYPRYKSQPPSSYIIKRDMQKHHNSAGDPN